MFSAYPVIVWQEPRYFPGKQILKLKQMGETILFSEQNVRFATTTAERAYVIDKGKIRYQGSIEELSANDEIKKKYLMI